MKKVQVKYTIDKDVKKEVDEILKELGITPSTLINVLYHMIVINNGIPFKIAVPESMDLENVSNLDDTDG